jgi:lysophospholipase L1-like esterase
MPFLKIIVYIFIFLVIGEVLIRIDETIAPFANDDQFRVAIKIEESPELKLLEDHKLVLDDSTYRVMILGDSYIHGSGIEVDRRFAYFLKKRLLNGSTTKKYKKCLVLDVSRPSNNNLDNYRAYKAFSKSFRPQLTILAYNHNDVENDLEEGGYTAKDGLLPSQQKIKPSYVKRMYNFLYQSHAVQFCMHNINLYLKSVGYLIPHSVFDEILRSYTENKPRWVKSESILTKFVNESAANKDPLVVILMPEYDLLHSKELFSATDSVIGNFFTKANATFINPVKYYDSYDPKDLRLSKYDGHPNAYAHQILADSLVVFIRKKYLVNP